MQHHYTLLLLVVYNNYRPTHIVHVWLIHHTLTVIIIITTRMLPPSWSSRTTIRLCKGQPYLPVIAPNTRYFTSPSTSSSSTFRPQNVTTATCMMHVMCECSMYCVCPALQTPPDFLQHHPMRYARADPNQGISPCRDYD